MLIPPPAGLDSGDHTFLTPIGAIDGLNPTFQVHAYQSGSLVPTRDGLTLDPSLDDGAIETDPSEGFFDMKVPPRVGTILLARYRLA